MKNPAAHNQYLLQAELVLLTVRFPLNTSEEWAMYDPRRGHSNVTVTGSAITQ